MLSLAFTAIADVDIAYLDDSANQPGSRAPPCDFEMLVNFARVANVSIASYDRRIAEPRRMCIQLDAFICSKQAT